MSAREQLNDYICRIQVLQAYQTEKAKSNICRADRIQQLYNEIEQIQGYMKEAEAQISEASSREDRLLREFSQVVQAWEEEEAAKNTKPKENPFGPDTGMR